MKPLGVLSVASEIFPLVKTGGLADVTGALPRALAAENVVVHTLIPGYPAVMEAISRVKVVRRESDLFGGPVRVLSARAADLDLFVVDAPHLFDRPGNLYLGPDGRDWPDNPIRFAALARIAADFAGGLVKRFVPDVVHAHDWQAGFLPAYLHYGGVRGCKTIMTVHNLAFAGKAAREMVTRLDLPSRAYAIDGVEFYGNVSSLKAGLQFADRITTVSPTYATEILMPEAGMGFDGLLRARSAVLSGILNAIDTNVWNPASDPLIAARFTADTFSNRSVNKEALRHRLGLDQTEDGPLFGVVSRLTWQKGMDLVAECLPLLRECGAQLVLLGTGEREIEAMLRTAAVPSGQFACVFHYDEELAHLVQAGVDALLMPSRFEPCGLTQLCALRYGAVPVVARVGGLADTVIDANHAGVTAGVATGVQFTRVNSAEFAASLRRTVALYRQPAIWDLMRRNGMSTDVSWNGPAKQYAALFRSVVESSE
jgi:starch synthase